MADTTTDATADDQRSNRPADDAPADDGGVRSREVAVPMRVYKTVTVFSTLIAMVLVIAGFLLIDAATQTATLPLSAVNPFVAIGGLLCIVGGAVVYAFSTRFRTEGMGNAKDADDEDTNNG